MPETMTLPFKNRALGLKDQKLWKIGFFLRYKAHYSSFFVFRAYNFLLIFGYPRIFREFCDNHRKF